MPVQPRKKIIVLNGIHGSGKSTVGKRLAEDDPQYRYFPEIGGQLREEVDFSALHSGREFDAEVVRRELARDAELERSASTPIVETWHFGNLAYILTRNPELAREYEARIKEQLTRFEPEVILLDIRQETFRERASEKVAPGESEAMATFFRKVADNLRTVYREFGIRPMELRNEGAISEIVREVSEGIKGESKEGRTKIH